MSDQPSGVPFQISESTIRNITEQEDKLTKLQAVADSMKAAGLDTKEMDSLIKSAKYMLAVAKEQIKNLTRP